MGNGVSSGCDGPFALYVDSDGSSPEMERSLAKRWLRGSVLGVDRKRYVVLVKYDHRVFK